MSEGSELRPATEADLDQIPGLVEEALLHTYGSHVSATELSDWIRKASARGLWEADLAREDASVLVVVTRDNLAAIARMAMPDNREGWHDGLYLGAIYARALTDLERRLLRAQIERARDFPADGILLHVSELNPARVSLAREHGFELIGERQNRRGQMWLEMWRTNNGWHDETQTK